MSAALEEAVRDVLEEYRSATAKHPPLNSPHEGISVIREELDELWDEVKADCGSTIAARDEATQVAAMALRYMVDLTEPEGRH